MSKTKKILIAAGAVLLAAMIVGAVFLIKSCGANLNGTYYAYINGEKQEEVWVKLDGSKWSDYNDNSGKIKKNGDEIVLYLDDEEYMSGPVKNGVFLFDAGIIRIYFCKDGKTPEDFENADKNDKTKVAVTLNACGGKFSDGNESKTIYVKKNSKFSVSETPARTGYALKGWATEPNGSKLWSFADDKATGEITLYAVWEQVVDAITAVNLPGATIKGYDIFIPLEEGTYSFDLGAKITCSSTYSWKLIESFENGGEEIDSKNLTDLKSGENKYLIVATPLYGGEELYYHVTVLVKSSITITFYDGETKLESVTITAGSDFKTDYEPYVQGYTFNGWKTESGEAFSQGVLWVDTDLYADKTPVEYKIILDAGKGNLRGDNSYNVTFGETFTLPCPTISGQKFIGWFIDGKHLTDGNGKSISVWDYPADGKKVVAKYGDFVEVIAESENTLFGTVSGSGTYGIGERVTLVAKPEFGYEFLGWSSQYGGYISREEVYTFEIDQSYRMLAQFRERSDLYNYEFDVNGDNVTLVGVRDKSVYSLDIPDGVTSVSAEAINGCYYLSRVTVPASVKHIGSGAFENCGAVDVYFDGTIADWCDIRFGDFFANPLSRGGRFYVGGGESTALVIPASVEKIDDYAFAGYVYAKSISISSGVTDISSSAFTGCKNVEKIIVEVTNKNYISSGNCLIEKSSKTLITGCKNSVISSNSDIRAIGDGAFYGCDGLRSANIPNSVSSIGNAAFYGCAGLNSVSLPQNLEVIGEYAFYMCGNLGSVTIPENIKEIGKYTFYGCESLAYAFVGINTEKIGDYAFADCAKLAEVVFAGNLSYIGERAFANCPSINRLELDSKVSHIGNEAFLSCSGIERAYVQGSLKTVGKDAFTGCGDFVIEYYGSVQSWCETDGIKNLRTDRYVPDEARYAGGNMSGNTSDVTCVREVIFRGEGLRGNLVIPAGIVTIGDYAFAKIRDFSEVTISEGVKNIGEYAFGDCSELTEIVIPGSVVSIGTRAFVNCTSLSEITYNGDVTSWCNLEGVENLRVNSALINFKAVDENGTLVIADTVTEIKDGAFADFGGIRSIEIPDSVTYIGVASFMRCRDLVSVIIPDTVETIGDYAFSDCDSLLSVVIGSKVRSIGSFTFSGCDFLQYVSFGSKAEAFGTDVFRNCDNLYNVNFEGSVKDWCENDYVSSVLQVAGNYFRLTINGGAFPSELVIPNGTTRIAEGAFKDCGEITDVTIPGSVKTVGKNAFRRCVNLKNVVISNGVSVLDDNAFAYCGNLESLSIGNGVAFGSSVFYECEILKKIDYLGTKDTWVTNNYMELLRGWFAPVEKITVNGGEIGGILVIPDSVTKIGDYAFYNCDKIERIEIVNGGVTSIGDYAFYGCSGIKGRDSIYLGDKLTSIGDYAFYGCSEAEEIDVGKSVYMIGDYSFGNCSELVKVSLGSSLGNLGNYVFNNCGKLQTVNYAGTKSRWNSIVSTGNSRLGRNCAFKIVCTDGSLEYKGANV